jgi:hypothetical protein
MLMEQVGIAERSAVTGLENRRAYSLRRYPSMFSASYFCALVH